MMAGARVDVNDKKRNPLDFVLWKRSKEGEPSWDIRGNGQAGMVSVFGDEPALPGRAFLIFMEEAKT